MHISLRNNESRTLQWQYETYISLEPGQMNCGRCAKCNCWTTDSEKADPIQELGSGATVDVKLLCDECLPPDHPIAF